MNKRAIPLFIIIVMISSLYLLTTMRTDTGLSDEPMVLRMEAPVIVMFGTPDCKYCRLAQQFFDKHKLAYTEHNIEASDEHRRMFDLLGGRGTPLIIINKELIHGFDERVVRDAL